MNTRLCTLALLWMVPLCLTENAHADADWPRFRGPNGSGLMDGAELPESLAPATNMAWKVPVDAGISSPIIAGGRLYLTSLTGDDRSIQALDPVTGAILWTKTVTKTHDESFTPPNASATPTPVSDGERVFALFPDYGILAYSKDGGELWKLPLESFSSMHGISNSLVLADDILILQADQLANSFIAAYRADTGAPLWKRERINGFTGGFSTPAVHERPDGTRQLITMGPLEIVSYRLHDGERLWWAAGLSNAPVSVPVITNDAVIVCEPVFEALPWTLMSSADADKDGKVSGMDLKDQPGMVRFVEKIDREHGDGDGAVDEAEWDKCQQAAVGKGGLAALPLDGSGDISAAVRWNYKRQVPYIPSVVVYNDVLYMIQDAGLFTTFNPGTGDVIKRGRLEEGRGQYWASPIAGDGKIFLVNTDGRTSVIRADKEWEEISSGDLGEPCWATPAIADGRIYVRTERTLWCFTSGADENSPKNGAS